MAYDAHGGEPLCVDRWGGSVHSTLSCYCIASFQALACMFTLRFAYIFVFWRNIRSLQNFRKRRLADQSADVLSGSLSDSNGDLALRPVAYSWRQETLPGFDMHFYSGCRNDLLLFDLAVSGESDGYIRNNGKVRNSCWT